jgi:hypothetical protein
LTDVAEPEILDLDSATDLVDGVSSVSFGTAVQNGAALTKTFTVRNSGNGPLTLEPITVSGAGFSLTSANFTSGQTLAAGASVTFTVQLATATVGAFNGTVSFANSDVDENPFNFAITGTVTPGGGSTAVIIDNTPTNTANFSTTGTWGNFNQGRDGDMRLSTAAGNTATWTFTNLEPGTYRISTTWVSNRNNTTQAQYQVAGGASTVTTVVNQTTTPVLNLSGDATRWSDLSSGYVLTGTTLTVTLTSLDAKATWADAVRIERDGPSAVARD